MKPRGEVALLYLSRYFSSPRELKKRFHDALSSIIPKTGLNSRIYTGLVPQGDISHITTGDLNEHNCWLDLLFAHFKGLLLSSYSLEALIQLFRDTSRLRGMQWTFSGAFLDCRISKSGQVDVLLKCFNESSVSLNTEESKFVSEAPNFELNPTGGGIGLIGGNCDAL